MQCSVWSSVALIRHDYCLVLFILELMNSLSFFIKITFCPVIWSGRTTARHDVFSCHPQETNRTLPDAAHRGCGWSWFTFEWHNCNYAHAKWEFKSEKMTKFDARSMNTRPLFFFCSIFSFLVVSGPRFICLLTPHHTISWCDESLGGLVKVWIIDENKSKNTFSFFLLLFYVPSVGQGWNWYKGKKVSKRKVCLINIRKLQH